MGNALQPLLVLVGPTATGKSELAVDVALRLRELGTAAEVVNADSMLVYKGMDIGTAKPPRSERRGIPHHLIDIWDVTHRATVAEFQGLARQSIADIRARGAVPILVGGSALYTRAVIDQFEFQPFDPAVRECWEEELARRGAAELHAELAKIAPGSAEQIDPGNGRRLVRALEIAELSGGHVPNLPKWTYALANVHQFGLWMARSELDLRVDMRVEAMWEQGLVDEVRRLLARGLRDGVTASRAIGYRQVISYLDAELTENEAKEATKKATRRFVRRQLAWYRRDERISWLPVNGDDNSKQILSAVELNPRN